MLDRAAIESVLDENDRVLSRTVKDGQLDTSVSSQKAKASELGSLESITRRNRSHIVDYICWRGELQGASSEDLFSFLMAISEITNCGLPSRGVYRTWELPYWKGTADILGQLEIEEALRNSLRAIAKTLQQKDLEARLAAIAVAEWEIGIGPIHPFQDGCGRTSRYFACLLTAIYRLDAVSHVSRDDYFAAGKQGADAFAEYYKRLTRVNLRFV
jgi:hypothetical protein